MTENFAELSNAIYEVCETGWLRNQIDAYRQRLVAVDAHLEVECEERLEGGALERAQALREKLQASLRVTSRIEWCFEEMCLPETGTMRSPLEEGEARGKFTSHPTFAWESGPDRESIGEILAKAGPNLRAAMAVLDEVDEGTLINSYASHRQSDDLQNTVDTFSEMARQAARSAEAPHR